MAKGPLTTLIGNFAVQNLGLPLHEDIFDVIAQNLDFYIKSKVPHKEVSLFCYQLSVMTN